MLPFLPFPSLSFSFFPPFCSSFPFSLDALVPGAFRVEMQRESQKDRTILCKYEPTEPGDYRIEVKWSGENVPGSPFMVMIFDTQEELSRFLQVKIP